MSDSCGNVIELLAVEENNTGQSGYLRVRLFLTETVEWIWETDRKTVQSLAAVLEMDGLHKYRLSFHTTWDVHKECYKAQITKTYREQSTRYVFICSAAFKNNLEELKSIRHPQDVLGLPFMSRVSSDQEPNQVGKIVDEGGSMRQLQPLLRLGKSLKLVRISFISVFLVTFLSSFSYSHPSVAVMDQAAGSDKVRGEMTAPSSGFMRDEAATGSALNRNNVLKQEAQARTIMTNEPDLSTDLPYVELEQEVTFGLPEGFTALTFDDGPSQYSIEIMNILKEHGVGGTFFFVGTNVKKHPDYVRAVHESGYSIGSHSMTHAKLPGLDLASLEEELTAPDALFESIIGHRPVLFRPPYGAYDEMTESASKRSGKKVVLWNRDPEDWLTRDKVRTIDYIKHMKASGSIVILHESQEVVDSLPEIIAHLQSQNLNIVSLR